MMTFFKRCARLLHNMLHINRLEHQIACHEKQLQELLVLVDNIKNDKQQHLSTPEAPEIPEVPETSTPSTSVLETNFNQEILAQLRTLEQRIEQKNTIISPPSQRPKLAYISPLPPERSGISDYSAALLPVLARYYDIEVIVAQSTVSDAWIHTYCPIRNLAWFQQHASSYARILYNFGNSLFHSHMFALLRQHPGVVVLHDFYLSGVLALDEKTGAAPWIWSDALYHSHGYAALQARYKNNNNDNNIDDEQRIELAKEHYPSNLEVLQKSLGIITHSEYAKRLAQDWYGPAIPNNPWFVIPHLKKVANIDPIHRLAARKQLGINEQDFVVCSMGFIDPSKSNHRLLEAWLASRLASSPQCKLFFVGTNHSGAYGQQLLKDIADSEIHNEIHNQIHITGWTDLPTFQQYVAAADLAVQLRSVSRGETSGAVLDCMSHGLATIVNANGSMADLPKDAVWMLPEFFGTDELVSALETLWQDTQRRHQIASAAYAFIKTQHQPNHCAERYQEAIETFYRQPQQIQQSQQPKFQQRQLFVDISNIARHDLKTGIERVVRAQLLALIANPPKGWRIEPVYLSDEGGAWHYRYARAATCALLGMASIPWLEHQTDSEVVIQPNDIFYAPDFHPSGVIAAAQAGIYTQWKEMGVSINFLIHDLLPVLKPEFFPEGSHLTHAEWLQTITACASRCICISHAVADELRTWLKTHESASLPHIAVLHHGADIAASAPSQGLPDNAEAVLQAIQTQPSFLMVGTIEPRKAYLQTLAGFEALWRDGHDVKLVIVGHEGWTPLPDEQRRTIPETVAKLRNHPELGQRLLWLEGISDEYLQKIYQASSCLLAASEGEGFGLPLIEAARYQLPIIARDLPVFREVAQSHAYYFHGDNGDAIKEAVVAWLDLHANGTAPSSDAIQWQTWTENSEQLLAILA